MSVENNIVLIRPDLDLSYPFGKLPAYLPLGLGYVAGVLRRAGFAVTVLDCYLDRYSVDELVSMVKKVDPLFVGISVNIASVASSCAISKVLKKNGMNIVVGGPQVTVFPEKTMRQSGADVGIIGEGENTILEIADFFSGVRYDLNSIKGIAIGKGDVCVVTEKRGQLNSLDDLPFMPWELFPYKRYVQDIPELKRSPVGWMSTSRGCPWDCHFCSNIHVWGRKYRSMSPERVVDEMDHLNRMFGIKAVDFREDNFTANRKRVLDICRLMQERGLNMDWVCESRVDIVDDELLSAMYTAGCRGIYFGIESGTQRVLDFLNKGITLEQIENAVRLCKKNRIKVIASVMLGVPTQTKDENKETVQFVKRLSPDIVYFNPFIGIPGSKTYDYIREKGLIYKEAGDILLANSEHLTWPEKLSFKQRAELMYNLSPRVFCKHLRRMGPARLLKKGLITLRRYMQARRINSGASEVA